MSKKCSSCGEKIIENELGKLKGTVVKIKKAGKNELSYLCSNCQKSKV